MEESLLYKYFKGKISELTGIPIQELTFEKMQTLAEDSDYPTREPLIPATEVDRTYLTHQEVQKMREENDRFLSRFKKMK